MQGWTRAAEGLLDRVDHAVDRAAVGGRRLDLHPRPDALKQPPVFLSGVGHGAGVRISMKGLMASGFASPSR